MRGDACDVYGSGGDVDKEQDIVGDETLDRADLDAQEVRRRQTLPVSLQKRRPSGVRVSLRSGLDPVISEDIGDGAASNAMSQIGQCASDSRVSPGGILKRYLQNEIDDGFHDAGPAWAAPIAVTRVSSSCNTLLFSGESTAFGIRALVEGGFKGRRRCVGVGRCRSQEPMEE